MATEQSRPPRASAASTRERILDAAATIMHREGLIRATTKHIAAAAGCSEALLYKHFPDKRDLFLRVLTERSPRLDHAVATPGTGAVVDNVAAYVVALLRFYEQGFPVAASIFGSRDLLAAHRAAMDERGAGPHTPCALLTDYLIEEQHLGRIGAIDVDATARLLTGAALHEAFLATYAGVALGDPELLAQRLVAQIALTNR